MGRKLELELDDGERRVLKLLAQAHKEKETVQFVRIEYWGEENGIRLSNEQFSTIMEQVGSLPNLKEVILHFTYEAPPLPVRALEKIIFCHTSPTATTNIPNVEDEESEEYDYFSQVSTATRRLEYLSLHQVKLSGSFDDFFDFSEIVRRNRSLKKVHLCSSSSILLTTMVDGEVNISLPEEITTDDTTTNNDNGGIHHGMTTFLQALASLPCLETLHLDNIRYLSRDAMTDLCYSTSLTLLEIWNMDDVINKHGQSIAQALEENRTTLRELEISSNLSATVGNAIINMLQRNATLETLGLDIDYEDYGECLANVFLPGHNSTLNTLHLRLAKEPTAVELQSTGEDNGTLDLGEERTESDSTTESKVLSNTILFIKALERNTSLEHLHMNYYHIPPETVQEALVGPFTELLQHNFVLKHLSLRGKHNFVTLVPKLEFCIRLNKAGRYHLLLGDEEDDEYNNNHTRAARVGNNPVGVVAARKEWVETIVAHENDVSIVFYLLSMNPSLCGST